ncbi:hypothetical protein RvY_15036 [Ramazzottius varieornatus]|uniref:Chromo domain-containing protein n=1 Tax=Ramazzottius varieornatus TaxID=947166 RepID=A0A1D1VTE8_RAMVA|nr:hypothetical protein RvY_15036 [Ramazzottius varieornatus]
MADYDPDALYNVEAVRDHKGRAPYRQFFIKWEDYDESTNTWEPEANLVYNEVTQTYCREKGLPPIVDPVAEKERKKQERAEKLARKIKREEEEERLRKEKKRGRKEAERRRLEEEAAGKYKLPAPPPASKVSTPRADSPEIPLDLSRQGRASVTSAPVSVTPSFAPLIVKLPAPRPRTLSVSSESSVEFVGTSGSSKAASASASTSKASSSSPDQHSKTDVWNRDSEDDGSDEEDGPELFSVRKVLAMKGVAPKREFFVQWEGYESEDDTWEPESGVGHLDIVREFIARKQAEKDVKEKAETKRKREISEAKEKASSKATSSTSGSTSVKKPVKASSDKFTALLQKDGKKASISSTSGFKVPKAKTQTKISEEYKALWQKQLGLKDPEPVNTAAKTLHPFLNAYSPSLLLTPTPVPKPPEVQHPAPIPVPAPAPAFKKGPEKPVRVFNIPARVVEVYPDYLPDEAIKKEFPNEHFAMVKMVLGTKVHEPEKKEEPSRSGLPDELDDVWRPPSEDRFVALYNRLSCLRDKSTFFSGPPESPLVTSSDHMFERAMPDLRQLDWNKGFRIPEVIGNYMDYFKNRLLPAHQHAMSWTSPPTMLRFTPREVPASLHNELKDPDVMLHMGRDVMNYAKEKNQQRCSKQIVRPGRLRGPRRSASHRR